MTNSFSTRKEIFDKPLKNDESLKQKTISFMDLIQLKNRFIIHIQL